MTTPDELDQGAWESGEWQHLPYAVLVGLAENTLGAIDRELAQTHIDDCPLCRSEWEDLAAFRHQLLESPVAATPRRRPRWPWLLLPTAGLATAVALYPGTTPTPPVPRTHVTLQSPTPAPRPSAVPTRPQLPRVALRPPTTPAPRRRAIQVARANPTPDRFVAPDNTTRGSHSAPTENTVTLIAPRSVTLTNTRPTFSWKPVKDATRYQVLVAAEGDTVLIDQSVPAPTTQFRAPSSLPVGTTLSWEVHAYDSSGQELGSAGTARFQIRPHP